MRPAVVVSSEALISRKRPTFHLLRDPGRPVCGASLWHGWNPETGGRAASSTWVPIEQDHAASFARPCVACYKALSATFRVSR